MSKKSSKSNISSKKSISARIKEIRSINKLSQKRFANKIGVSDKTISAYENGKITPPYRVLEKISDTYDVSMASFSDSHQDIVKKKLAKLEELIIEMRGLV